MESTLEIAFAPKIQDNQEDSFFSSITEMKSLKSNVSSLKSNVLLSESTASLIESFFKVEDSLSFSESLFNKRDVLLNETWDISENVQGKIVSTNNNSISVDCLVDIETQTFQYRSFPIQLFENIDDLSEGKLVLIKTKMKKGSIRIDVYPGTGIVNEKLFKIKSNWEALENSNLDEKLTEW